MNILQSLSTQISSNNLYSSPSNIFQLFLICISNSNFVLIQGSVCCKFILCGIYRTYLIQFYLLQFLWGSFCWPMLFLFHLRICQHQMVLRNNLLHDFWLKIVAGNSNQPMDFVPHLSAWSNAFIFCIFINIVKYVFIYLQFCSQCFIFEKIVQFWALKKSCFDREIKLICCKKWILRNCFSL